MKIKDIDNSITGKLKENKLVGEVMEKYRASYDMKDAYGIRENVRLFHEYWAGENMASEVGGAKTNIIQAIIESQVADLTKADFDVEAHGWEPSDEQFSSEVEMVLDWIWDKNKMVPKIDAAERSRLIDGTVGWKVYYDQDALRGKGLVVKDYCPIETLFPDPKVTDPFQIQEGDFFIHTSMKSLRFFRRTFGKRGKKVKPEGGLQHYDYRVIEKIDISNSVISDQAMLFEYWEKDDDLNLRLIYCTQDVLLYDSRWEHEGSYFEHGMYPYVLIPCYKCKGRVWGKGDVEQLVPVQNVIDDLDDQILLNARLTANNQYIVEKGSGINLKTWTNEPGLKIPAVNKDAYKPVENMPLPMYVWQRREKAFQEAELVSGRPDVLEGRRGGSLRAASAIIALQEAGQRRGNHKALMLSEGLKQLEELVLLTAEEFMTEEQAFKITNNDQTNYKWFRPSDLKDIPILIPGEATYEPPSEDELMANPGLEMDDQMVANPLMIGEQPLVPLTDEQGQPMKKDADFDLKIVIGAGMPHNKSFMYQATIELAREGLITQEEARMVLKQIIAWPVIDPQHPVGQFVGRNLSPEMAAMMNGQVSPEMMEQQGQQMSPEVMQLMQMLGMGGGGNPEAPPMPMGGQLPPDLMAQLGGIQ